MCFPGLYRVHTLCCLSLLPVRLHVLLQLDFGRERCQAALAARPQRLQPRVAPLVSRQLRRALELELADVAGIRPLARVDALVQLSLAEREEGLVAVRAGERPLARVDEVVSGQRVRFGEALPAEGAGVRAGAAVGHDVLLLRFLALEALVALRAGVGPVVHVRPVMFGKLPLRQKALPALRAEERFLPGVHPLVSGQHRHQREPLGAVGALERPLACVDAEVFHEHEAEREALAALVTLVRSLPGVGGQMPLHVRSPRVRLLTVRTLELTLHLVQLPVFGACEQRVEAFAALLADVAFTGDVGLPVLEQLGGRGEALAADGAHVRELVLLRVTLLVVDGECAQVGEGAPAQLAGEGDVHAVMFALVFGQIPRVLEGAVALRAVKRPLSGVSELVSPDVGRAGERLAACFTRERLLSALSLRHVHFALIVELLCFALLCVSFGEKFNGCKDFIGAGRRRRECGS